MRLPLPSTSFTTWVISPRSTRKKIIDFSIINLDTVFWSVLMGVVGLTFMVVAARRATSGVPGRFQAFIEMVVEMVNDQAKNNKRKKEKKT